MFRSDLVLGGGKRNPDGAASPAWGGWGRWKWPDDGRRSGSNPEAQQRAGAATRRQEQGELLSVYSNSLLACLVSFSWTCLRCFSVMFHHVADHQAAAAENGRAEEDAAKRTGQTELSTVVLFSFVILNQRNLTKHEILTEAEIWARHGSPGEVTRNPGGKTRECLSRPPTSILPEPTVLQHQSDQHCRP